MRLFRTRPERTFARYQRLVDRELSKCRTLEEFDAIVAGLKTPAEMQLEAIHERRRREERGKTT